MRQSPAGGITTYVDVVAAEAAMGVDNAICYVVSTETLYRYEATGAAYTDNNTSVLSTGDGGNTRWLAIAGRYHYLEVISPGTVTTSSVGYGIGALASETTGQNNVCVGYNAGNALTQNDHCIAIGTGALDVLAGSGGEYDDHIAIGRGALGSMVTVQNDGGSIAIGALALSAQDAGYAGNVAIGFHSQETNTRGYPNTSLGYGSLRYGALIYGNTALGYGTLGAAAFDGSYNTAVGNNALGSASTSERNTAVGSAAGASTSGDYNVAIGASANGGTTGSYNVAVGASCGYAQGGSRNISIGYNSFGAAAIMGTPTNDTIAIGDQAMRNSSGTPSTCVAIGSYALYQVSGVRNHAIGYQSGDAMTTGTDNVLCGYASGGAITESIGCVAMGNYALDALTGVAANTSYHVAVGYGALGATTTPSANAPMTAVGYNALTAVTNGYGNVAVGAAAADAVTTGYHNCALGYNAFGAATEAQSCVAIGSYALDSLTGAADSKQNNHVAIGYFALTALTQPANSGGQVAVGMNCLASLSTGSQNTAVGTSSGGALTTGAENCCFGYSAMSGTQISSRNVVVGVSAMATAGDSQNDNVAIGYYAMSASTGAVGNCVVGSTSADALTTGDYNCTLGYAALGAATEAIGCVAIGYQALDALTGAADAKQNYHVAVGYSALGKLTQPGTAGGLVAVGYNALSEVTTGSQHTALGDSAGAGVSTNSGGIYLGYNAGAADTAANKLHIGNNSTLSLIEGVMTSGSEMAAVHGELRDDSTATANDFHCVYGERVPNVADDAWTTVCTLTPSATANVYTRGLIKIRAGGSHATSHNNGAIEAFWYFDISNANPTVGTVIADVTSGTAPKIQLAMSGATIQVQVEANDDVNHWAGYVHVEIWAPEDYDQAITYTFAH